MATTKIIALASSVCGGSSLVTGSVLLDNGSSVAVEQASYRSAPPGRHFGGFELSCVQWLGWLRRGGVFYDLKNPEKISREVSVDFSSPNYKLEGPSSPTGGNIEGCLRTTFSKSNGTGKIVGVTMEMAVSNGKHGIILLNTIGAKDKKGSSLLRALFLEKKNYEWQFIGGVQWSDEAFLSGAKTLKLSGIVGRAEDIDLETAPAYPLRQDPFTVSWKKDTTRGKNIYQHLTITADASSSPKKPENFWNEKEEPIGQKIRPSAVFASGRAWVQVTGTPDLEKAKDWFNIFKEEKGTWVSS